MEEKDLKEIVAQNIFYLRTLNHMTQYELGEQINYSDKAISKWERAEGIPDVYVISNLAQLFDVSVDYLLTEHTEQERKPEKKPINNRARALVLNVAIVSEIAVALFVFVILALSVQKYFWQTFIFVLPAIALTGTVFSAIWKRIVGTFMFISMLLWTTVLSVYVALGSYSMWMVFLLGIPAQILVFLSFGIKVSIKMNQKTNPILITAMEKIQKKQRKNGEK